MALDNIDLESSSDDGTENPTVVVKCECKYSFESTAQVLEKTKGLIMNINAKYGTPKWDEIKGT
jgi:hypothetical protein